MKYLPLILIAIAAAGLRLHDIESKNLWFDEVYSWKISQETVEQIIIDTSGDIHPPLYYIVLKYWTAVCGDSVFALRLLSVLIGIAGLYYFFKLSQLFTASNFQITLILLLYAVSPLNIYYSQEVRMLNLNLLLCLAGVYHFYLFLKDPEFKNAFFYTLFTFLSLYTHYFAFLILITEVAILGINYFTTKRFVLLKRYLICFAIVNVLYIPWFSVFFGQIAKGQPWRKQQTFKEASEAVLSYFKEIFFSPYVSFESMFAYYMSAAAAIFVTVLLVYFIFRIFNQRRIRSSEDTIILFFVLPLIFAWIISLNQSIILSRYLSIIIPYLFISIVIFSFIDFKARIAATITICFIAVSIYGTKIYYENNFKNNDYRRVISYMEQNVNPGDRLVVEPHYMGWSIDYYLKHNKSKIPEPEVLGWNLKMQSDSLFKRNDFRNVWLVIDYSSLEKKDYDSIEVLMAEHGFHNELSKTFYLIPDKVKVYYFISQERGSAGNWLLHCCPNYFKQSITSSITKE